MGNQIQIPFIGTEESTPQSPQWGPLEPPSPSPISLYSSDEPASSSSPESSSDEIKASSDSAEDENYSSSETVCETIASEEDGHLSFSLPQQRELTVEPCIEEVSVNTGYKIVFDNIDKNIKPRFMRSDYQTRSLHYVNSYAVKDRINFSQFLSETPTELTLFEVLPNDADYKSLKDDFTVLVSRMIVEHMAFFSADYKGLPAKHISHPFSKEMASKSEVVSI